MTTWTGTDPSWDVTLIRSPEGNAAFTTSGLATHNLPDLAMFAPPETFTEPRAHQDRAAEMLVTIADAVIQIGRIPTDADNFRIADATGTTWPLAFEPLNYVLHDLTAALTGRAQATGLVSVYPII